MSNINYFVTSDTHFNHKKIIDYCDRNFESVEAMNEYIISQWNRVVQKHDKVYHLGDFSLYANKEQVKDIVNRLNGHIILIKGNHDNKSTNWYYDCGFYEVYSHSIIYDYLDDGYPVIMSHKPIEPVLFGVGFYNLHGHLHRKHYGYPNHTNVGIDIFDKPVNIKDILSVFKEEVFF